MKALHETHLLPRVIAGSSVGSIIAAIVCVTPDDQLPRIFESGALNFQAFFRRAAGKTPLWQTIQRRIMRLWQHGALMDVSVLDACARDNIGDITFEVSALVTKKRRRENAQSRDASGRGEAHGVDGGEREVVGSSRRTDCPCVCPCVVLVEGSLQEAFIRTGRFLNIMVTTATQADIPRLLNHLTAPHVVTLVALRAISANRVDLTTRPVAWARMGAISSFGQRRAPRWRCPACTKACSSSRRMSLATLFRGLRTAFSGPTPHRLRTSADL